MQIRFQNQLGSLLISNHIHYEAAYNNMQIRAIIVLVLNMVTFQGTNYNIMSSYAPVICIPQICGKIPAKCPRPGVDSNE